LPVRKNRLSAYGRDALLPQSMDAPRVGAMMQPYFFFFAVLSLTSCAIF
jgi:hypothetical protein